MKIKYSELSLAGSAFALCVLLAGCGGGSAGSNVTSHPLTTTLRSLAQGDTWTYNQTVSRQTGGGASVTGSGVRSVSVVNGVTINAAPTLQYKISDGYSLNGTNVALFDDFYFTRSNAGDVQLAGDDKGAGSTTRTAATAVTLIPGTFGATVNLTGSSNLNPSGTFTGSFQVLDSELVTIFLGNFNVWKVSATTTTAGVTRTGTYWYSPVLGSYVKSDETVNDTNSNTVTTIHSELASSTVTIG